MWLESNKNWKLERTQQEEVGSMQLDLSKLKQQVVESKGNKTLQPLWKDKWWSFLDKIFWELKDGPYELSRVEFNDLVADWKLEPKDISFWECKERFSTANNLKITSASRLNIPWTVSVVVSYTDRFWKFQSVDFVAKW